MVRKLFVVAGLSALAALSMGCAKKPATEVASVPMTSAAMRSVNISDELTKLCHVTFGNVDRAPKFDYDDSELLPQDRDVLEQIAKCVTTGPLKGRKLALVGRADPRGETEYNMALGEHRADSVKDYLSRLGVASNSIGQTSRGELDAKGQDEETWKQDRRVDVTLD